MMQSPVAPQSSTSKRGFPPHAGIRQHGVNRRCLLPRHQAVLYRGKGDRNPALYPVHRVARYAEKVKFVRGLEALHIGWGFDSHVLSGRRNLLAYPKPVASTHFILQRALGFDGNLKIVAGRRPSPILIKRRRCPIAEMPSGDRRIQRAINRGQRVIHQRRLEQGTLPFEFTKNIHWALQRERYMPARHLNLGKFGHA